MTGQAIAVLNRKGGVGKTTTAVGLGELAARTGRPAAVVDLDPQAGAGIWSDLADAGGDAMAAKVLQPPADVSPVQFRRWVQREAADRLVVLDCPPGGIAQQEAAAEVVAERGGVVIVPTTPNPADIVHTLATLDDFDDPEIPTVVLLTMVFARTVRQAEARAELVAEGAKVMTAEVLHRQEIARQGASWVRASGQLLNLYHPVWLELGEVLG